MIVSRALPVFTRLNHVIKLNPATESRKYSVKILCLERVRHFQIRTMSSDIDAKLNDPNRHLDYQQLIEKKKDVNVVVIDVRDHSEIQETGKIPGSIHIPLAELGQALSDLSPEDFKKKYDSDKPQKDNELIFSCKAGGRSSKALKLGLELGYQKSAHYKGGWLDWAKNTQQNQ